MTVYAPTDHTSITIPAERGGCGMEHKAGLLEPGEKFRINCPACEPFILKMRTGWAATPEGVSLTPDEIGEVERDERDAKRQQNRTWGDPSVFASEFAKAIGAGSRAQVETPTLLAQIASLAPEERAALAGMLLASSVDTVAVGGSAQQLSIEPADSDEEPPAGEESPASVVAAEEPVRRGPGRPRTRT